MNLRRFSKIVEHALISVLIYIVEVRRGEGVADGRQVVSRARINDCNSESLRLTKSWALVCDSVCSSQLNCVRLSCRRQIDGVC